MSLVCVTCKYIAQPAAHDIFRMTSATSPQRQDDYPVPEQLQTHTNNKTKTNKNLSMCITQKKMITTYKLFYKRKSTLAERRQFILFCSDYKNQNETRDIWQALHEKKNTILYKPGNYLVDFPGEYHHILMKTLKICCQNLHKVQVFVHLHKIAL